MLADHSAGLSVNTLSPMLYASSEVSLGERDAGMTQAGIGPKNGVYLLRFEEARRLSTNTRH
jgi:hypothetical protein